jgi:hypothetical protein
MTVFTDEWERNLYGNPGKFEVPAVFGVKTVDAGLYAQNFGFGT